MLQTALFSYERQIMGYKQTILILLLILPAFVFGQFAPPAGQAGSDAVHRDSSIIINWASNAFIERVFQQIDNPSIGYASFGSEADAIGKADGMVVSLGDGGSAVLGFDFPVFNGPGADFVVFENAFDDHFLELAHVAVSSDGENFYTFPSQSLTQTETQIEGFGTLEATKIHLLAGKYSAPYGLPFNLDSLPDADQLDKSAITHIRITDVVGSLNADFGSQDVEGRAINDPWPTPFPSSGFDLDGVGVMNDASNLGVASSFTKTPKLWPNPFSNGFEIISNNFTTIKVFDLSGKNVFEGTDIQSNEYIDSSDWTAGLYIVLISTENKNFYLKAVKQ